MTNTRRCRNECSKSIIYIMSTRIFLPQNYPGLSSLFKLVNLPIFLKRTKRLPSLRLTMEQTQTVKVNNGATKTERCLVEHMCTRVHVNLTDAVVVFELLLAVVVFFLLLLLLSPPPPPPPCFTALCVFVCVCIAFFSMGRGGGSAGPRGRCSVTVPMNPCTSVVETQATSL